MAPEQRTDREYYVDLVKGNGEPMMKWKDQKRLMIGLGLPLQFISHVEVLRWQLDEGLSGVAVERVN